jgi:hypothetical protein
LSWRWAKTVDFATALGNETPHLSWQYQHGDPRGCELFWQSQPASSEREYWRTDLDETPTGAMSPIGIHMLDLLCLCRRINTVNAQSFRLATTVPSTIRHRRRFRFESGMSACFATLGATARTMRLQIFGTRTGWRYETNHHWFSNQWTAS